MDQTVKNKARWNLTTIESLHRMAIVHHVEDDDTLWASMGRTVFQYDRKNKKRRLQATLPFVAPRDFFARPRLAARASRADKCNVYVNTHGNVLTIRANTVYALDTQKRRFRQLFTIQGDCVLSGGMCEDPQGWTYLGEYFQNVQRGPVRIWRVAPDLDRHEVAYEFPAHSIRHIHGVYRDPHDETALWTAVGDYENECYLLRSRDRFASVDQFGDGTQIWRAVTLFFTPNHVCWLTDSHLDQNYACRMDRESGELELGQKIACSGWYGLTTTDGLFIGFTTVERGPGIHSDRSSVLVSEDGFHWSEAGSFLKDRWRPMRLFKNGVISCPSGKMASTSFYISGEGLVGFDGRSRRVRVDRVEDNP